MLKGRSLTPGPLPIQERVAPFWLLARGRMAGSLPEAISAAPTRAPTMAKAGAFSPRPSQATAIQRQQRSRPAIFQQSDSTQRTLTPFMWDLTLDYGAPATVVNTSPSLLRFLQPIM